MPPAKRVDKSAAGVGKAEKAQLVVTGVRPGETKSLRRTFQVQQIQGLRPVFPFKGPRGPRGGSVQQRVSVSRVSRASQFQSRGEGAHMEGPMGQGGSWPLLRSEGPIPAPL